MKLASHDIHIKIHILTYYELGFCKCTLESLQSFFQGNTILLCKGRGNAVNLFRLVGDVEPIGFYQHILMFHKISHFVVQLPCNLHTTGPVVGVCYRGVPALGQSSGLGIKN